MRYIAMNEKQCLPSKNLLCSKMGSPLNNQLRYKEGSMLRERKGSSRNMYKEPMDKAKGGMIEGGM